ncbi:hypothetical protein HDF26_003919 [Pedobacter cryoconitis]|uniref:DUF1543 domain-containing protein n=1 Tax=Pedobacter cryoconitis TaxID=188932 RepID=A0A7W8ZKE4_9SPHI|nr:DUF1543 domain-containing protein [Pedobacter cryoconitis]MBB5635667.1 hypothetical protein [Pedobacter cryoconitis]MBB6273459.1 hypothetical protein [Pedobacter cryoconitis]
MGSLKLYQLLLGCKPAGRNTEQHDVLFAVGTCLKDLIPGILNFWPEADGRIHVDAWREVNFVEGFQIQIVEKESASGQAAEALFFLNLGGYKKDEFDELHYKMLLIGADKAEVIRKAKESAFFLHTGFAGAPSHIDDKYGVDVDDLFEIEDVLPSGVKEKYRILISASETVVKDEIHLGYLPLKNL